MNKFPKYVLVAGYNNFRKHKGILQIFKDYCEMIPHVIHKEDTWSQTQDFYVFPDYPYLEIILQVLFENINHCNIFRFKIYRYNSINNSYVELHPNKPQIGIVTPSRIKITPELEEILSCTLNRDTYW